MPGGARNGRTFKLAVLVGLVLLTLYFFVSWRMEVAAMAQYVSSAEGEYQSLRKRFNRLETELKDSIVRESRLEESLQKERQSHSETNTAKNDLEANCKKETEAKKTQVIVLEREKAELQEQIQAVKADRDAKSQEAQRLKEELHEAKENADDEYQALSATCVTNQQTCEKRAKLAEDELVKVKKEAETAQQSSQDCHSQLTVQQELARSCNVRVSTLEKEGAGRLSEIEQLQTQLHLAHGDNTKLTAQLHELQNSLVAHPKSVQQAAGQREEPHHLAKRYDDGNVEINNKIGELHRDNIPGGNQFHMEDIRNGNQRDDVHRANVWDGNQFHVDDSMNRNQRDKVHVPNLGNGNQFHAGDHRNGDQRGELQKANFEDRNQFHFDGNGNGNQRYGVYDGGRFGDERRGGEHDRLGLNSYKKAGDLGFGNLGGAKESFDDFRISDDQKMSVLESLQGKVARGETLDERQQKIFQLLLKDFDRIMNHNQNAPVQNGMGMEHHQQQQQEPAEDDDVVRADGGKQQQLPNPLDDGEEVKDLVEGHQKPEDFDNLGDDRKLNVVDREREQDEAAGAGGEEPKQPKDGHEGREDEVDHQYLHEDVEEKADNNVGDNPLPQPGQEEENPDDEDNYAAKKGKHEGDEDDDVYGDNAYKQDQELFKHERQERLQGRKFDRQL